MGTAGSTRHASGLMRLAPRLRSSIPGLGAAVSDAMRGADPGDAERARPLSPALRRSIEEHLRHVLDHVVGPADPQAGSAEAGAPRAADEVPMASLLRVYRLSTRVLWEAVRDAAEQDPAVSPADLVRLATDLWAVHDAACAALERDRRGCEEPWRPRQEQRDAVVTDLLEGRLRHPVEAREAAAFLGLRPVSRYAVVVMDDAAGADGGSQEPDRMMTQAGYPSAWQRRPERCIGIVDVGGADLDALARALSSAVPPGRAGISPVVDQLSDLPAARRHADTALLTRPPGEPGIAILERDLPGALLVSSPELAPLLLRRLGPVLSLDDSERGPLLATVQAYAATGASATDAARTVRCHRNTVLNRVRRFEVLSGQPLDTPEALLTIWLATRAHDLRRSDA